jgi:hypothetical protein
MACIASLDGQHAVSLLAVADAGGHKPSDTPGLWRHTAQGRMRREHSWHHQEISRFTLAHTDRRLRPRKNGCQGCGAVNDIRPPPLSHTGTTVPARPADLART